MRKKNEMDLHFPKVSRNLKEKRKLESHESLANAVLFSVS